MLITIRPQLDYFDFVLYFLLLLCLVVMLLLLGAVQASCDRLWGEAGTVQMLTFDNKGGFIIVAVHIVLFGQISYRKFFFFNFFLKTPKTVLLISQQPNIAQRTFCIQNERQNTLYHLI